MGEEGMVNMAVQEFTKVRMKKAEKEERERELRALSDTGGPSGHQKLQVCDVCGAYLSRLDNDRRLADHFYGKMHLGYAQMRKSYEALQKDLKGRAPPRDAYPSPAGDMDRGGGGVGAEEDMEEVDLAAAGEEDVAVAAEEEAVGNLFRDLAFKVCL